MKTRQCVDCGAEFSVADIHKQHADLYNLVELGQLDDITPMQEAVFYYRYCPECSNRILIDEQHSSQVYYT